MNSQRNITLAYFLCFFKNTWFWLGIWVLYYLRFTNYAGIGLIETVLITTTTLTEIPTGAIADLLGKKKTLIVSFLLQAVCQMMMAFAPNLTTLVVSVFIGGLGGTLYSGTFEALVYDSLKEHQQEGKYPKIIANIGTIQLIAPAVSGVIGGLMYVIDPRLPFVAAGVGYFVGLVLSFFLSEPSVDTEVFSFQAFIHQTKKGFHELTKSRAMMQIVVTLLSVGVVVVIADEMMDGFLGVEFGYRATAMSVLFSVIYLVAAGASQLTPKIMRVLRERRAIFLVGGLMAILLLLSPLLGLLLGGAALIFRNALQAIFTNMTSIAINHATESRYRATTLSTFNMLKNIPYVLSAYLLGSLADIYSARILAAILGGLLMLFLLIQWVTRLSFDYAKEKNLDNAEANLRV